MKKWIALCLPLIALFINGCFHNLVRPRLNYTLEAQDGIVTTDSPSSQLKRRFEKIPDGGLLRYSIIIENTSKSEVSVNLKSAFVQINDERDPSVCGVYKNPDHAREKYNLSSGKQVRVECTTAIKPTPQNKLKVKDSMAKLEIPFGDGSKTLEFAYRLRIEDFE